MPRRDPREVLELDARRRVFELVARYPGAHLRELARLAGLDPNHALYHLDQLDRAGLVAVHPEDGYTRYFPRATEGLARDLQGAEEKRALALLRKPAALRIVLALLAEPAPLPLRALAARLGAAPSSLHYHLDRLVARGLVARLGASAAERAYALADRDRVRALLLRYPPQPDLVARFVTLWDGLALPRPPGGDADAETPGRAGEPSEGSATGGDRAAFLGALLATLRRLADPPAGARRPGERRSPG